MAEVEQVAMGTTQLPSQRTEGVPESGMGWLALADTKAVPPPLAPPLLRRVAVPQWLHPRSSQKRKAEVPALAPLKSLKVGMGSTAHQVVVAQREVTGVAMERAGEETPTPHEAEAYKSDGAEAPSVVETTEELEKEASRAAEASRVEVHDWKEKAEASRVEAQCWKEKAEASRAKAQRWEEKAEELEKEVTWAAKASITVQAVLKAKIRELDALKSAAHTRALAIISSHYASVDLGTVSDGYVLPEDDEEVVKLMEAAEGPGTVLARLFEEEVVPPPPSADARDPEP
ncbi:uncharacterized protein [Miscanthus floridulus]|uniref:uncharacterized protein n=1 Tax=Miscanthus floridulus TaxID=154761 RepID=UPI003459E885